MQQQRKKNEVDSHVYIYHVLIIPLNMFSLLLCMHWRDLSSFNRRIILFEDVISCERFVNAFSVTTVIMINRQKSFGELAAAAARKKNETQIESNSRGFSKRAHEAWKAQNVILPRKPIESERTFPAELLKTNFILHLQQQSHVQKTYCFAIVGFYLFCFQPQRKICPQFNSVSFVLLYVMRFDFALEIKQQQIRELCFSGWKSEREIDEMRREWKLTNESNDTEWPAHQVLCKRLGHNVIAMSITQANMMPIASR